MIAVVQQSLGETIGRGTMGGRRDVVEWAPTRPLKRRAPVGTFQLGRARAKARQSNFDTGEDPLHMKAHILNIRPGCSALVERLSSSAAERKPLRPVWQSSVTFRANYTCTFKFSFATLLRHFEALHGSLRASDKRRLLMSTTSHVQNSYVLYYFFCIWYVF